MRGIFTANDLPQPVPRYGPVYADRPMLASGETKFSGEPVAVVVADTEDAADTAARLVRIDFEELPAVLSIDAALDADAPLVQDAALRPNDRARAHEHAAAVAVRLGRRRPRSPADLVVENDYAFPMVTHFAIEPHAFLAAPDANGVTVWSPTQHPYVLQRVIAAALELADRESPDRCAGPGRRVRRQGLAESRAADGMARAPPRAASAARADARRNVSGRPPRVGAHSCANRLPQ